MKIGFGGLVNLHKGRVRGGELDVDDSTLEMKQGGARVSEGLVDHVFCPPWALGGRHLREGPALAARWAGFSLRVRQAEPNIALSFDLTSSGHLHALVRHAWQQATS